MSNQLGLKVNLLTFHRALSYGAVLQTYAMVKTLQGMGHEVTIIDYQKPFLRKIPTGIWSLKKNYGLKRLRKENVFLKFRIKKLTSITIKFKRNSDLLKYDFKADWNLVGSDQVWNPRITKDSLKTYFFDFIKSGNKISYAASFGAKEWIANENDTLEVKSLLSSFKAISVREDSGKHILKAVFNVNATIVLDPTLIWSDYSDLINPVKFKNYIICFQVNLDDDFIKKAIEIAKSLNLQILLLGDKYKHPSIISIPNPSVESWVSMIKEASFVFTDSFHGLAFSLNFNKEFIMYNSNLLRFTRIDSLLGKLGLTNRVMKANSESIVNIDRIDYAKVNDLLKEYKKESFRFLESNLI
jgi:hypothetical protein